MSQHSESKKAKFLPRLESLRGLAALMVAGFHASVAPGAIHHDKYVSQNYGETLRTAQPDAFTHVINTLLEALLNGSGAVNLFFVLSGFVLAASIHRGPRPIHAATGRFLIARAFRLYPAIWASVAIFAAVHLFLKPQTRGFLNTLDDPGLVVLNLLLLNTTLNGVMWSIQLEIVAIPLILVTGLLSRRWGLAPLVASAIALFALSFHGTWTRGIGGFSLNPLFGFALGMLVQQSGPVIRGLRKYQATLLVMFGLVVFFGARLVLAPSTGGYRWIIISELAAAAIVIAIIAFRDDADFAKPLDGALLRFYGRISYSFYLLHPLTLIYVWGRYPEVVSVANWAVPQSVVTIVYLILTTAATTPLAWLSWRYVELPCIALGRRIENLIAEPKDLAQPPPLSR